MGPHPAVARVRHSVRRCLREFDRGLVLVACSGGADSLALADAVAFEAPRRGLTAGAITVDHGLQDGSADRAGDVARVLTERGLAPVEIATVSVDGAGGMEASARRARYRALDGAAARLGAVAVLLGHTRDDQAETVLLGLARGSGPRSLAGMAPRVGAYRRPLLDLPRSTTVAVCAAVGLAAWDDPHNADWTYGRARVRHRALPVLEEELGPGIAEALARTADLYREDADALDLLADEAMAACLEPFGGLSVSALTQQPTAIRRRVLRSTALAAGCPPTELFAVHVRQIDTLITAWRGQVGIDLPGGLRAVREDKRLLFTRP